MPMIDHFINTRTMRVLQKGMEGTLLRTRVSMNNLANVDTPGFKRQTVTFEDQLRRAMNHAGAEGINGRTTHPRHIPIEGSGTIDGVRPRMHTDLRSSFRADGNNVDIDQEMVAIANAAGSNVRYTELMNRDLGNLRAAIRERV